MCRSAPGPPPLGVIPVIPFSWSTAVRSCEWVRMILEHNSRTQTKHVGSFLAVVARRTTKSSAMHDLHYFPLIIEFGALLAITDLKVASGNALPQVDVTATTAG